MVNQGARVLVTGGVGFIGSYVVERLISQGLVPVVLDRAKSKSSHDVILGDVRDSHGIHEATSTCGGVIHLAAVLGTQETIAEPESAIHTNIHGSMNVFRACLKHRVPCVYITVGNHWMNNPYSITKTTAERFAWMMNREFPYDSRISVVRALNAYGPRQKEKPVRKIIPNFILPALRNEEIVVYGDGNQVMDMIYVEDVADILVRALITDHGRWGYDPTRTGSPPVFEAGTGRWTTVVGVASEVIRQVGGGRVKHVPMRPGEPEHSVVLGEPQTLRPLYNGEVPSMTTLEDGLAKTIEWYRERV